MSRMMKPKERQGRELRRTSLYLDAQDRYYLAALTEMLGLQPSEVLRLALRTLAHRYGLLRTKKKEGA